MQAFERLRRKTWSFAGIFALIIAVVFLTIWLRKEPGDVIKGIIVLFLLLLLVQFIASLLAAFCALIPIKHYDYNARLEGWIPLWTVVVEGGIMLLFVFSFFLEFW